jgi:hypothetical protein
MHVERTSRSLGKGQERIEFSTCGASGGGLDLDQDAPLQWGQKGMAFLRGKRLWQAGQSNGCVSSSSKSFMSRCLPESARGPGIAYWREDLDALAEASPELGHSFLRTEPPPLGARHGLEGGPRRTQ